MQRSTLSKFVGAGFVALGLTLAPLSLSASAQGTTTNDPATTLDQNTTPPGERVATEQGDRDFDWGWLGLLGLIGLAGLKGGKKHDDSAGYRDSSSVRS